MVNHNQLHNVFIGELKRKIPQNPVLVNMLVDILCLEKEAIYRRLRQDVPFTFYEIALISKKLSISLDNVAGNVMEPCTPLQLRTPDFINSQSVDYLTFSAYANFLKIGKECGDAESAILTNTIPHEFFSGYRYLTRYNIFNWQVHCSKEQPEPFHALAFSEQIENEFHHLFTESKYVTSHFIFDKHIFRRLVNNINYFNSIRLIEKNDVLKIKEDLLQMLDYIENIAISGVFKETGSPAYLYISDIDITSNYTYVAAGNYKYAFLKTFLLTFATSVDEYFFEKIKNWIHSFIRISTLITVTNEKQRVLYFEKQRKIVNEL
jgi:hypothetical protein